MKLTFIRHGSLLPPFDNYDALSLSVLSQLALQKIEPTIDRLKVLGQLKKSNCLEQKYDKVFVSPSKRTQDTALELSKNLVLPNFKVVDELKEVLFDPSTLLTSDEYDHFGLQIVRDRLFTVLANNSNIESGSQVIQRLRKLQYPFLSGEAKAR